MTKNPFALEEIKNPAIKWLIRSVSRIDGLEKIYDSWLDELGERAGGDIAPDEVDRFTEFCLEQLQVSMEVTGEQSLENIPQTGSAVFVANHPLGGIEGVMLTKLLLKFRPDLKVLTNELLSKIPEFKNTFIGVDVLNTDRAHHNARGIRAVSKHLAGGGALLVFPAGTVSGIELPSLRLVDRPWSEMITRMARRYDAPVTPIFVEARNSLFFYLSGFIHKRLRTALLPRAMLEKTGQSVTLHVGETIPSADLKRLANDSIAIQYIRFCCQILEPSLDSIEENADTEQAALRDYPCSEKVSNHVLGLESYCLLQQERYSLYCAPYSAMGPVMEHLSIIRESTFREVNEGTGKELDSDRFDPYYRHLFLWDREKRQIAGGYRLGNTDKIAEKHGLNGLYSHSLFDYNKKFLRGLGKTIEVGRSFVATQYQKDPAALDLLWKGIGRYVAQNSQYHTLFGCVSISAEYSNLAKSMLIETFLSHYGVDASITSQVKARSPVKFAPPPWARDQVAKLSEIPVVNKLVGRIDSGKSIPTLIRHYLALKGRFVSFSVNKGFNDSLDGLILVDLRRTPARYLKRYLGTNGSKEFIEFHEAEARSSAIV